MARTLLTAARTMSGQFPGNLAWTMAFTHDDGWLGAYFAEHPDRDQLSRENERRIKKQREIELAESKGWM